MSRSCQRALFSKPTAAFARKILAMPHRRSARIGFLLWGIAEDPFCPGPNGSASSRTSVRWEPLISSAIFSIVEPSIASVERTSACLSRCTTWVEAGDEESPSSWQVIASTFGSTFA
jgi:hypothetical protein